MIVFEQAYTTICIDWGIFGVSSGQRNVIFMYQINDRFDVPKKQIASMEKPRDLRAVLRPPPQRITCNGNLHHPRYAL